MGTIRENTRLAPRRIDGPNRQSYHTVPAQTDPSPRPRSRSQGRQVPRALSRILIVLGIAVIAAPFVPQFTYYFHTRPGLGRGLGTIGGEAGLVAPQVTDPADIPADNTLVVPAADVQATVHEGASTRTLLKGVWHRPTTSTPDKGSNTVLTAHRFMYTFGQNTFYHLDKVKPGEVITVYWNKQEYQYTVFSQEVVGPENVAVEQPTDTPTLTLYTCTPLWTSKNRLVIKARLTYTNNHQLQAAIH